MSIFSELFQLPADLRWTVSNSGLLRDVYILREKPTYGPRGFIIRSLVGWTDRIAGTLFLTRLVVLVQVTLWWWRSGTAKQKLPDQCRVFVGCGAGIEERMWQKFIKESDKPAVYLDRTKVPTFGCFYRPKLMSLWKGGWSLAHTALDFLGNVTIKEVVLHRKDFVTIAILGMPEYVFYLCWWSSIGIEDISQVTFNAGGLSAHACLNAGFSKVEYRQHGLLRKSGLMPEFPVVKFLTEQERDYYLPFLPQTIAEVISTSLQVKEHRSVILLSSAYDNTKHRKSDALNVLTDFFAWAEDKGMQIIIRKHPRENDDFWQRFFPQTAIDQQHDSFENTLLRLRPMIMMTWFSTTIIDALRCNVVPVSICDMGNHDVQDLILNLEDYCLLWADSRELLDQLVEGKTTVESIVGRLNNGFGSNQ